MTPQDLFVTRLRTHRERTRVTLEEVAARTLIKREQLEALERNDLSTWPRGLYARAWVRAYADVIGLDADDVVDEFCRLFPHGDRRARETMQGVAAIVAQPSDYTDGIAPDANRRRDGAAVAPSRPVWHAPSAWRIHHLWRRVLAFRSPTPRLKRSPRTSS
jgi:hypothetical protein